MQAFLEAHPEIPAIYVLLLAVATVVALAMEKVHLSVCGVGLVLAVAIPGLLDAKEAVSGFANTAVITVAALYIVGEGFLRTGAASVLAGKILQRSGGSETRITFLVMGMAATLSAFINNTLVVITFLPVVTTICQATGMFPSRLLIPISYASILGGMCTLVGTSTNLLVSGVLQDLGQPTLQMFDTTLPGLCLAISGMVFLGFVGRRVLPRIPTLTSQMGGAAKEYVTELTIGASSPWLGKAIGEVGRSGEGEGPRPLMLVRDEVVRWPPFHEEPVVAGDILMFSGRVQDLASLQMAADGGAGGEDSYDPSTMSFFELAVTPTSSLAGQRIGELALKSRYGAVVVAVQRAGKHIRERLSSMTLRKGDALLVFGDDRSKALLRQSHEFHLIEGVADEIANEAKARTALVVAGVVIAAFMLGVEPVIASLTGALLMVLTRCLSVRQAHSAVNWPILVFIGGTLALSKALVATGGVEMMAGLAFDAFGGMGGGVLVASMFVTCVLLTELLSNNAVAVIMTPVAVQLAALADGVSTQALVLAVALGASCSFANPMGYKTNIIVMGPGGYRFMDYLRAGAGLDVLLIAVGCVALPWLLL